MAQCGLTWEQMLNYHDGSADAETRARVAAHLAAGCPDCARHLAQAQRITQALGAEAFVSAPDAVLQNARALFRERFRKPARRALLARLVFDSRTQPVAAGARGADGESFQLLYQADGYDIDVWQEREDQQSWYLIGSVVPAGSAEAQTPQGGTLRNAAGQTFVVAPEPGEFHAAAVPPGVYELTLTLPDMDILLPDVAVGR